MCLTQTPRGIQSDLFSQYSIERIQLPKESVLFITKYTVLEESGIYFEGDGQRLVAAPVRGQDGAEEVGAVSPDQLGRVVRYDLSHAAVLLQAQPWHRAVLLTGPGRRVELVHLGRERLEATGRRAKPPRGTGIYGNAHHNRLWVSRQPASTGKSLDHQASSPLLSCPLHRSDSVCLLGSVRNG